jgi:6-phosphogluconolactonase
MLKILNDPDKVAGVAADLFVETAREAVKNNGRFSVALSGGHSPEATYKLLSELPRIESIPWDKVHLFWGDERYVPHDDPRSNIGMAREQFINNVPIPDENVHEVPYEDSAEVSAEVYGRELHSFFDSEYPEFDLIYLGLGTNGHTASLFPHTPVLKKTDPWYASVYLEDQQMYRTTLTIPAINHAKNIAFIVFGEDKSDIVKGIIEGPRQPEEWPAQYIKAENGEVHWLLDSAASARLAAVKRSR